MTPEEAHETGIANEKTENSLSSVKIIKNSKGYNFEIKVYDENPWKACSIAEEIEDKLRRKYGNNS